MLYLVAKVFFTAIIIVLVSEVAKKSDQYGGLLAALPLTTVLIIFWMYFEGATDSKISNHLQLTLYFVLPTLPMFLFFPYLIHKFGFPLATLASIILTSVLIYGFKLLYEHFGFKVF